MLLASILLTIVWCLDIATILRNYVPEYKDKPRLKEGIKQSMVDETRKKLTKNKEMSEEEIEEFIRDKFYDADKTTTARTGRIERDSYPEAQIEMLAEVEEHLDEFKDILSNLVFRTEKGAKERRIQNLLEATTLKPKFGESDEAFRERVIQTEGGIRVGQTLKGPLTKSVSNFQKQNPNQ